MEYICENILLNHKQIFSCCKTPKWTFLLVCVSTFLCWSQTNSYSSKNYNNRRRIKGDNTSAGANIQTGLQHIGNKSFVKVVFDGSILDVCTEPEGNWGVWPHGLECQLWEHTGWISQSHRMNLIMEEKRLQTRFSTVVSILIYIFPSFGSRWNLYFIKLFPTWPFQAFPYICQVWFNMTFKKELFWLFLVRDPCATSVSLALSILLHIKLIKAPRKKVHQWDWPCLRQKF